MNIAIVELYKGNSGTLGYYNNQDIGFAKKMANMGHHISIFYPSYEIEKSQERQIDNNVVLVHCPVTRSVGVHTRYNWDILKEYGTQVVQVNADNQIFAYSLVKYCEKNDMIIYCYIGAIFSDSGSAIKRYAINILSIRNILVYRKHKCFAKTSSILKELIRIGAYQPEVAPVGLDTSIIPNNGDDFISQRMQERNAEGYSEDTKILLFVGRMDEYKKPIEFLNLVKLLLIHNIRAIMIGTGSLDDTIEKYIDDNALTGIVKRIKCVTNENIHRFYRISDYFINLNEHEIFGMSILEAMYQGCEVIAVKAPGPNQIIVDGVSGHLVNGIAEIIDIIEMNTPLDKNAIHERIRFDFTWNKTAKIINEWIETYKKP